MPEKEMPVRFVGLDVHKHYLVAVAVDPDKNEVMPPRRVQLSNLDDWVRKNLTRQDAVVLEMTTNTFQLYDELLPHVHSVTVVHPPHVALITRAQVMTDKIAARTLARLHAARLLPEVWVPPDEVRDHRVLVAQRAKMMRLATQARNRLHAVLHRITFFHRTASSSRPRNRPGGWPWTSWPWNGCGCNATWLPCSSPGSRWTFWKRPCWPKCPATNGACSCCNCLASA